MSTVFQDLRSHCEGYGVVYNLCFLGVTHSLTRETNVSGGGEAWNLGY